MFSLKELKAKCKEIGLKNYSKLKKAELVDLINIAVKPVVESPVESPVESNVAESPVVDSPVEAVVVEKVDEPSVEKVVKPKKQRKPKVAPEINIENGPVVLDLECDEKVGRKLKKKSSK